MDKDGLSNHPRWLRTCHYGFDHIQHDRHSTGPGDKKDPSGSAGDPLHRFQRPDECRAERGHGAPGVRDEAGHQD